MKKYYRRKEMRKRNSEFSNG